MSLSKFIVDFLFVGFVAAQIYFIWRYLAIRREKKSAVFKSGAALALHASRSNRAVVTTNPFVYSDVWSYRASTGDEIYQSTHSLPLNAEEKKTVLRAAEMIASGRADYMCKLVDTLGHPNVPLRGPRLSERLAAFYGSAQTAYFWDGLAYDATVSDEERELRVLLLLTFAELG